MTIITNQTTVSSTITTYSVVLPDTSNLTATVQDGYVIIGGGISFPVQALPALSQLVKAIIADKPDPAPEPDPAPTPPTAPDPTS
jgi:hypothetical protein